MKTKKLIEKIAEFLSPKERRKKREMATLKKLCAKLVEKEAELAKKLKEADSEEKTAKIRKKIALVKLQREKGCTILDEQEKDDKEKGSKEKSAKEKGSKEKGSKEKGSKGKGEES